MGIEQDSDGKLSVDSTTFDEKFTENLPLLMDLFADTDGFDNGGADENTPGYYEDTTADGGLMNQLSRAIDQMFGVLGTNGDVTVQGIFDVREDAIEAAIDRYDDQITRREDRLESYEQTLILRFARLEELMGGLNAQGAALANSPRRLSRPGDPRPAQPGTHQATHPTSRMSSHAHAAEAYLASAVENAPPIKIVRMLYQGALRFIMQAEGEDAAAPSSSFVQFCSDADAIVAELRLALDAGHGSPEVVDSLTQLYLFCEAELQRAMIDRSPAPLAGVKQVLTTLLEAWDTVEIEAAVA